MSGLRDSPGDATLAPCCRPPSKQRHGAAVVLLTLIGAVAFCAVVLPGGLPAAGGRSTWEQTAPDDASAILDSDEHGALVMDQASGDVVGYDATGAVRWRDRDLAQRLYVSCLDRCPDAVGSGATDGGAPPPVVWRTGTSKRIDTSLDGTVLWALTPQDAVVARPGAGRLTVELRTPAGTRIQRVDGTDSRLYSAPDSTQAVLVVRVRGGSSYRMLTRGPNGWAMSAARTASVSGACLGRDGQPVLLYGADSAFLTTRPGAGPRRLPVAGIDQCAVGADAVLTQEFSESTNGGPQTTTRLLDMSGKVLWRRTDPGMRSADLDPDTGLVAVPTDIGVLVLDTSGKAIVRIVEAQDAQFVRPGCLLVLSSDHSVGIRCLSRSARSQPTPTRLNPRPGGERLW
jgi:hypothetical protein